MAPKLAASTKRNGASPHPAVSSLKNQAEEEDKLSDVVVSGDGSRVVSWRFSLSSGPFYTDRKGVGGEHGV
jgi:hypothetical protein